jgi:hypothetical protein
MIQPFHVYFTRPLIPTTVVVSTLCVVPILTLSRNTAQMHQQLWCLCDFSLEKAQGFPWASISCLSHDDVTCWYFTCYSSFASCKIFLIILHWNFHRNFQILFCLPLVAQVASIMFHPMEFFGIFYSRKFSNFFFPSSQQQSLCCGSFWLI